MADLDAQCRDGTALPAIITAVGCGMDRMEVLISEPADAATTPIPRRRKPYERTQPEPRQHNHRMAWAGNSTLYDQHGAAMLLHSRRAPELRILPEMLKK